MRFKGWKQIFGFTYLQQVKSKSFIASTVIVCVLIIAIFVLVGVLSFSELGDMLGGEDDNNVKAIDTLYIYNETDITGFNRSLSEEIGVKSVDLSGADFESRQEEVKAGDKSEAVLHVEYAADGPEDGVKAVSIKLYRPQNKELVSDDYMNYLAGECRAVFKEALLLSIGVEKENIGLAETVISSEVMVYGDETSEFKQILNTVVPMLLAAVMYVFIVSYAQIIAQSVAMEKTSRVIELLITSVRPLAIVAGKVFAMLLVVITQLLIIGAAVGVSVGIFALIAMTAAGGSGLAEAAQGIGEAVQAVDASWQTELLNAMPGLLDPVSIIAIVIIFLLGFLFYALLAALIGAGISRSEDLATGIQPLALISVIGFFLSYMPPAFNMGYAAGSGDMTTDTNILTVIARYLPISSPFALPSAIILGQIGTAEIIISTVILAALTFGTMLLVAKVYENIILYSGSVLKLGQIIKMAKSK
ncbi:MAG: ABC transporter permease [Ruminococcaceae bacterium]|nr:ABC transporter permease [Oscillospiraceae bacterium]